MDSNLCKDIGEDFTFGRFNSHDHRELLALGICKMRPGGSNIPIAIIVHVACVTC